MTTNKTALAAAVFLVVSACTAARLDSGTAKDEAAYVRVAVRFAKVRRLPDPGARAIREIGFGTMLKVLEASGDFFRVAALDAKDTSEAWYILRSEVEPAPQAEAQAVVETRSVTFTPPGPAVGQQLLFTASGFRTPKLLKWDMGDGTVLTTGGKASRGGEATLAYAYAAAGTFMVKIFDGGGSDSLPPVTAEVTVSAHARALQVRPERPAANHPVVLTALNFRFPEKIAWDLGDGTRIDPGPGPGVVKPTFQVSHSYEKEGTYTVRAYDGLDKAQAPLSMEVLVAADPRRIRVKPERAEAGAELEFTAVGFSTPDRLRWDMGDGTVIFNPKESGVQVGSQVKHSYRQAGEYEVRVYDWNGDADSLPVSFSIAVGMQKQPLASPDKPYSPPPARPSARKAYPFVKAGPYAGYFQPQDTEFKNIYGDGDVLYGGRLGFHAWKGLFLWLSLSQYRVISKTTFTGDKTTLTLMPFSVFLRYNLGRKFVIPYAGIGYTFLSFKEESDFVGGRVKGKGSNFSLETGFELKVNRHFYVDFGARFDQVKFKPEKIDQEIDLGGLQAGISLLLSF
jgi:hypothetical protein